MTIRELLVAAQSFHASVWRVINVCLLSSGRSEDDRKDIMDGRKNITDGKKDRIDGW